MKTILITGANTGIGLATTKKFLREGYRVCAHYHTSKENLSIIKNPNLHLTYADLGNLSNINQMFNECKKITMNVGPDILINNAAVYEKEDSIDVLKLNDVDKSLDVNLKAPFILTQKAMRSMKKKKWGRIINISSISVKTGGSTTTGFYTISKAALEVMTLAFSKVGAPFNILVNTLRVGTTNTNLHKKYPDKNLDEIINNIPLGRMAEVDEITSFIYYLSSMHKNHLLFIIFY